MVRAGAQRAGDAWIMMRTLTTEDEQQEQRAALVARERVSLVAEELAFEQFRRDGRGSDCKKQRVTGGSGAI